jgi:hypothetical protein
VAVSSLSELSAVSSNFAKVCGGSLEEKVIL